MINVFQPALGREELEAVGRVFESNWIGKGRQTSEFEAAFAHHLGIERELLRSTTCCTEGMFQAIKLLDIRQGDEVILPTISFVGAANAVASAGGRPVFCDVDSHTLNPTASCIEAKLSGRTRAVLLLHYGGLPCEMDPICELLERRGIALIEDSACSVASRYKGRACGTFGEVGSWSFDAMKILVTGEGGMVYCRTPELADRFEKRAYLGLETKSGLASDSHQRWWEFDISCFGRRAITNDLASAIGLVQLHKLSGFIERRKRVHEMYDAELSDLGWLRLPPTPPDDVESSHYFYWVQTEEPDLRDRLAVDLRERGIYTTFRYYPLHWVEFYGARDSLPDAERAARTTLCIPMHHSLTDADVKQVVEAIQAFGGAARP